MTISRGDFEELIQPLVDQTLNSVDATLRDSGLSIDNIDDLVLVGGSTRIPLVTRRLSDELKLEPSRAVNPDLAVALGAATQAAMFDGHSIGPVLVDITGHTLGFKQFQHPFVHFQPREIPGCCCDAGAVSIRCGHSGRRLGRH